MIQRLKHYLFAIIVLCSGMLVALPAAVSLAATPTQTACSALGSASCADTSGGPSLNTIVKTVISVLSLLVGIIAVIMIIVAGLRYVTSNGDSNSISGAKNTLIYALVGLVVAAMAQLLVQFVLNKIT